MEFGESVLCGGAELELDPDIVSEEAGKLYSELQVTNHDTYLPMVVNVGLLVCFRKLAFDTWLTQVPHFINNLISCFPTCVSVS